ncbi:hypothetical protein G5B38_16215 [Pseudohalocynthiibacter aestuariivivens]|uniref:Uncharacterized protein n=1 Tax=Roseovarius pelagicus TaxID=2980108 RepID=A0ABY6DEC5_9RHOB|nr:MULTISPECIES: hypothetical protein [Rhodobacterales]QIE46939.1 hypothetical protein G5B38_16215 [Pseudohalocynthiibacter aestuariivivens]UXX84512.1 hypothetical protein N7U68_07690 [Roseovarius pelagicus]
MITHLPADVQAGLDAARKAALMKSQRLRVVADEVSYRVLRTWPGGFSIAAADAPPQRGLVELYDGPRHLAHCLIFASGEEAGEILFDFKQRSDVSGEQPLDFVRAPDAPVALITKGG